MSNLTVVGSDGSTVRVSISSAQNAIVAQNLLSSIDQYVDNGKLTPYEYAGTGSLTPPTTPGYLIVTGPGSASLSSSTNDVVNVANGPVLLFGGNASVQSVVSDFCS